MATGTITQGKAARKTFALFYAPSESEVELIGKGIEEMSIEQGAEVDTVNDVCGNSETSLDSYQKTTNLEPIYIVGGNKFSELLDDIEEYEKIGDEVEAEFIWAKMYKKAGAEGSYAAWKQTAVIELTSFGGNTKGVGAPCTLHWIGERTHGTFDPKAKTFTPTVTQAE